MVDQSAIAQISAVAVLVVSHPRTIHFVGSYPASSPDAAMREMLQAAQGVPKRPLSISDGETSRFELYVEPILEDLVDQTALRVTRRGSWADVKSRTRYRPGPRFGSPMRLGYSLGAADSLPLLQGLRDDYGLPGTALQVGMPTPRSIALVALGARGLVGRYCQPFVDATVSEISELHQRCGDQVVVQLEATAELAAVATVERARGPYRRLAGRIGASIAAIAAQCPPTVRFGVHLCFGDLHNTAAVRPRSAESAVELANAVANRWPEDRPLEYVHFPVAAGRHPPVTERAYYRALSDLRLAPDTVLCIGLAHEAQSLPVQQEVLRTIDHALGRPLDAVSTPCGLGRRSPEVAQLLLARLVELANSP
jgi:hypothetical protein